MDPLIGVGISKILNSERGWKLSAGVAFSIKRQYSIFFFLNFISIKKYIYIYIFLVQIFFTYCVFSMGRQLSVILWVIGIHLLISTGYGSIAPQTGSCSGEFKDAVPKIHSLSDSSALGSFVMVDLAVDVGDRDGLELPEFNQHVGLQVEARYGGLDLEGLSQHHDPHNVGVRSRGPILEGGIDDQDGFDQHVDLGPSVRFEA